MHLAPTVQAALHRARQEAELWNHLAIGAGHLLFGLLREAPEVLPVLRGRGIVPRVLQAEVERDLAPGPAVVTEERLPFDGAARRALERAWSLAQERGQAQVGAIGLLEALLAEGPVACAARPLLAGGGGAASQPA